MARRLDYSDHRRELDENRYVYAVVSRRACSKRRCRNSPCMREDVTMVLVMAGMKVLIMFAAAHWRATGIIMKVLRERERLQRSNVRPHHGEAGEVGETGDPPRTARRSRLLTHPRPLPSPCIHPPAPVQGQSLDIRRWRSDPHWL